MKTRVRARRVDNARGVSRPRAHFSQSIYNMATREAAKFASSVRQSWRLDGDKLDEEPSLPAKRMKMDPEETGKWDVFALKV